MGETTQHSGAGEQIAVVGEATADLTQLQLDATIGGLVFVGPTTKPMRALAGLLESPEVEPVQANGARLADWLTSPHEVLQLTRQASSIVRWGRTAVIYLDSHQEGSADPLPESDHEFVCWRMGRIILGMADAPSYIAVHGQEMAQGVLSAVCETDPEPFGEITPDLPVAQLTEKTMFPGVLFATTPGNEAAAGLVQALDFFEARRL